MDDNENYSKKELPQILEESNSSIYFPEAKTTENQQKNQLNTSQLDKLVTIKSKYFQNFQIINPTNQEEKSSTPAKKKKITLSAYSTRIKPKEMIKNALNVGLKLKTGIYKNKLSSVERMDMINDTQTRARKTYFEK